MSVTLIMDYWTDFDLTPEAIRKELDTIDRVITKRIQAAVRAYEAGLISAVSDGEVVDDLLRRRSLLTNLLTCLNLEETLEPRDRVIYSTIMKRVAGQPKGQRFS